MTDYEVRVGDQVVSPDPGWSLSWVDRAHGVARLSDGERFLPLLVEGSGADMVVTLRGRRIPVTARSWRERLMAEAERASQVHAGPVTITLCQ